MSGYDNHLVPTSSGYPYHNVITSHVSPATTVAINLRQFEKDSKAQAEREYDEEHGPLPEPPADDDPSIDERTRVIAKKKRKVRSAIVSRRKSAIYVEKLENELEMRDNVNADLETRLGVFRDVLRETTTRIRALQRALDVRRDVVQKRVRHHAGSSASGSLQQVSGTDNAVFFLDEDPNPIDDLLSISPEEIVPGHPAHYAHSQAKQAHHKAENMMRHSTDFSSECSDGQTSPVTPKYHRFDSMSGREFPPISLKEETQWRGPVLNKALFTQHVPFPGATAM